MTYLARIAERVLNRPLLLHPAKAEIIMGVLSGRIGVNAPSPESNRLIGEPVGRGRAHLYNVVNGAAVITIEGSLVNRGAWVGADSGLVSYEGIEAQILAALNDKNVTSIVLDVDSPGGEAAGMYALAAKIRAARSVKPVVALTNDMTASGAYGLSSQADLIMVSPTSVVGSIGVVLLHIDRSQEMAQLGRIPTLIHAGAHKVDANPFAPLSDEVKADLQAEVETFYDRFVEVVVAGRAGRLDEPAVRATEARTFIGDEAIRLGLADQVGGLAEAVAAAGELAARRKETVADMAGRRADNSTPPVAAAGAKKEAVMDYKDLTLAGLREHRPDLVSEVEEAHDVSARIEAAKAEAATAAAEAERARIQGIEQIALPGHEALAAEAKADGSTVEKFAVRQAAAEKAVRAARGQALVDADKELAALKPAPAAVAAGDEVKTKAQGPEGWTAEYEGSDKLRGEFGSAAEYVAFMRANSAGRVRVLNGKAEKAA